MFRNCDCCSNNDSTDCSNRCNNNNSCQIYEKSCNIASYNSEYDYNSCSCGFDDTSVFPQNWMYGHSYVPHQKLNQVYTPEIGLKMGTIFPELVSPYCPNQSMEVNQYLKRSNTIGGGCNS